MATRSLRRLRQLAGLTLEQLEARTGKSFGHLAGIERGERRATPETLRDILTALDAAPLPDPDDELLHDMAQPLDVLHAEAQCLHAGIDDAARRIGAGEDREVLLTFVAHAIRRQRAILRALTTRVESLPGKAN
jgi:transcriptional regulator with XRE-family HTH domain